MSSNKTIDIQGQNNRYLVKRVNDQKYIPKQRKEYKELNEIIDLSFITQLNLSINESQDTQDTQDTQDAYDISDDQKYIIKQVQKKINSYANQDKMMKRYNKDDFISLNDVFEKIKLCENKCYYCTDNLLIHYQYSREPKQWTLERKNNNIQHSKDNCVISCLECNLKRRNSSYDAFQYTKQMKIVKKG